MGAGNGVGLSDAGWVGLHVVLAFCVVLIVPLGVGALGARVRVVQWWPLPALLAVLALLLPRGPMALLMCLPYLLACLVVPVALRGLGLVAFAAACLPVAAVGLVAERGGYDLLGFSPGILGLTAAHFHVAGFGALLLLALFTAGRHPARWLAPIGVALVGVGFLVGRTPLGEEAGDAIELLGAGVLSTGLWLAIAAHAGRAARALFAMSILTMGLAVLYALGQVFEVAHLNLTWMVLTHGVLNTGAVLIALVVVWSAREQPWSRHTWSHPIGTGQERFEAASHALLTWDMHRRSGAWVQPDTPAAAVGLRMQSSLGVGPLRVSEPCEVTEVVQTSDRTSMHYVALPGHTFEGDERFTVLKQPDGKVTLEVTVRSRPSLVLVRLVGPFVAPVQWLFVARCAAGLRRAESVLVDKQV